MKCFMLFCLLFTLSSCGHVSPTHEAVQDAQDSIMELEKDLPKQCKTTEVNARIDSVKTKIDSIKTKYDAQVDVLISEKVKWKTAFFGLLLAICTWVCRKFII